MRMGWGAYVIPFLIVLSPTLIMVGMPWAIALNVVTATVGVFAGSVVLVGYFARPLTVVSRTLLGIGALAAVFPDTAIGAGGIIDLAGIVLVVAILGREWRAASAAEAQPVRTT
jgi:TRAP-type uncharacterized transport system fused permease subunit